jgi:hypothetical protein
MPIIGFRLLHQHERLQLQFQRVLLHKRLRVFVSDLVALPDPPPASVSTSSQSPADSPAGGPSLMNSSTSYANLQPTPAESTYPPPLAPVWQISASGPSPFDEGTAQIEKAHRTRVPPARRPSPPFRCASCPCGPGGSQRYPSGS